MSSRYGFVKRSSKLAGLHQRYKTSGQYARMPTNYYSQKKAFTGAMQSTSSRAPELKAVDIPSSTETYVNNTGLAGVLLNGVAAGTDFYNRVGRKVQGKSLFFNANIRAASGTLASNEYLRTLIVYDNAPNQAAATYADVVKAVSNNGTVSSNSRDCLNLDNRDRFKVLMDKRHTPNYNTIASPGCLSGMYGDQDIKISEYIDLKGCDVIFDSATATIADITTGAILLFVQKTGDDATMVFTLTYTSRFRYTDK